MIRLLAILALCSCCSVTQHGVPDTRVPRVECREAVTLTLVDASGAVAAMYLIAKLPKKSLTERQTLAAAFAVASMALFGFSTVIGVMHTQENC